MNDTQINQQEQEKVKVTANMPGHTQYHRRSALSILLLASLSQPVALAETITIGKGTGIVWEGLPFNVTLSGSMRASYLNPPAGLLAITTYTDVCQPTNRLSSIAGYQAFKVAPGVGLIPRASGNASFYRYNFEPGSLSGTLGLPETKGVTNTGVQVTSPSSYSWCLSPSMDKDNFYYSYSDMRTATISGTWVLVADGQQKAAEITLSTSILAASLSTERSANQSTRIFPTDVKLRISTLECTVNTPTSISFGNVMKNLQAGAELAVKSYPLITSCGQSSDLIDANINLQFRSLTGLYQSAATRLALREGGGYITGEINNGVTGSGSCSATSGLPFDNSQLKIGRITKAETSLNTTHQVTWRLCSGGKDLPLGNVSAAAEMLVTFN